MTIPVTMTHKNTCRDMKYFHTAHVCKHVALRGPAPFKGSHQELCATISYNLPAVTNMYMTRFTVPQE